MSDRFRGTSLDATLGGRRRSAVPRNREPFGIFGSKIFPPHSIISWEARGLAMLPPGGTPRRVRGTERALVPAFL